MASYLRPRRGKKSTAESQNIVLKRGEVFFECPDAGVVTCIGLIKVGDGITAYKDLPYFMTIDAVNIDVDDSKVIFTEATATDNTTLLNAIASGSSIKTIVSNVKKLLRNLVDGVTKLNNDLDKFSKSDHTHTWTDITGKPSTFTPASHNHNDLYYTESEINNLLGDYSKTNHTHSTYAPISIFTSTDPGDTTSTDYPDNTLICVYEEV